jgi:hypothetical protein
MSCRDYDMEYINRYADNELDDIEKEQFEAHMESCASCRDCFASLRDSMLLISSSREKAPDLWGDIVYSMKLVRRKNNIMRFGLLPLASAAALILLLHTAPAVKENRSKPSSSDFLQEYLNDDGVEESAIADEKSSEEEDFINSYLSGEIF